MNKGCDFCLENNRIENQIIRIGESFFLMHSRSPISPGHVMLVPLRHIEDLVELNAREAAAFIDSVSRTIEMLKRVLNIDGYNLIVNVGKMAGQHILHLHIHIIPRYKYEKQNPLSALSNRESEIARLGMEELIDRVQLLKNFYPLN